MAKRIQSMSDAVDQTSQHMHTPTEPNSFPRTQESFGDSVASASPLPASAMFISEKQRNELIDKMMELEQKIKNSMQ